MKGQEIIRGRDGVGGVGSAAFVESDDRGSREDEEVRAGAMNAASSLPPNLFRIKAISSSWLN